MKVCMCAHIHTHLSVWTYVEKELTLTDASGNLLLLSVFIARTHTHTHTRRSIYTEAGCENTEVLFSEKLLQTISEIKGGVGKKANASEVAIEQRS